MKKILFIFITTILVQHPSYGQCSSALWTHVYHPDRLVVYKKCVTVTGVIVLKRKEKDGDYHMQLKLDPGQHRLLNSRNMTAQKGCLVVEPICIGKVTQEDAIEPCKHCEKIKLPKIGDHVKVTGSFVRDTEGNHGWNEIHPVSAIEILPD